MDTCKLYMKREVSYSTKNPCEMNFVVTYECLKVQLKEFGWINQLVAKYEGFMSSS